MKEKTHRFINVDDTEFSKDRKIHLFILNGPCRREYLIDETLKSHIPYFDSVTILNKSFWSYEYFNQPKYKDKGVKSINVGYGDYSLPYVKVSQMVPIGDWFCYLDSDERYNQTFLDFIVKKELDDNVQSYSIREYIHDYSPDTNTVNRVIRGERHNIIRRWPKMWISQCHTCHCAFVYQDYHGVHNLPNEYTFIHQKNMYEKYIGLLVHAIFFGEGIYSYKDEAFPKALEKLKKDLHLNEEVTFDLIYKQDKELFDRLREISLLNDAIDTSYRHEQIHICTAINEVINNIGRFENIRYKSICTDSCCQYKGE
jgi:hypothetical protein